MPVGFHKAHHEPIAGEPASTRDRIRIKCAPYTARFGLFLSNQSLAPEVLWIYTQSGFNPSDIF